MPQRACDRCHSIRARCQFREGEFGCERCVRLRHQCTSLRKEKRPGRPRKNTNRKNINEYGQERPAEVDAFQDLDPWEIQIAVNFLQKQRFENSFVTDSDLSSSLQSTPIRLFLSAPARIKDSLLALAGVLASQDNASPQSDEDAMANMNRCCKAMERLRQSDVSSLDDAKATLYVATTLISFNDLTLGHGFLPVARAALLSIEPWYHDLTRHSNAGIDPHLIPVLFAEISECVKDSEMPSLRYDNMSAPVIDPSYGVAQGLLSHLYDLCMLRYSFNSGLMDVNEALATAITISNEVEVTSIDALLHAALAGNVAQISETQKRRILQHGQCYKLLARLLLLQIRQTIGDRTAMPACTASILRATIEGISADSKPQIQYVLFPYFVACTELEDEDERNDVLQRMEDLSGGIATQSCHRMFEFLQYAWAVRRIDHTACWLDMVRAGIDFSIGP